jgi:hypothetical protein
VGAVVAAAAAVAICACTSSGGGNSGDRSFQARPLIMPGQQTTQVRADPFAKIHVPANEAAYNELSRSQRVHLAEALRGVDCAHPPTLSGTADRVVCDAESDVFQLGAPIFTGGDVEHAAPVPPTASSPQWSVQLTLASAAADKIYRWTSRYHVQSAVGAYNDVQTSSRAPCGASTFTPCSDFLAYISDDVVLTVPVTFAPSQGTVLVGGEFTKASATQLARKIAG